MFYPELALSSSKESYDSLFCIIPFQPTMLLLIFIKSVPLDWALCTRAPNHRAQNTILQQATYLMKADSCQLENTMAQGVLDWRGVERCGICGVVRGQQVLMLGLPSGGVGTS